MKKIFAFILFSFVVKNIIVAQATWNVSGCGPSNPSIDMVLIDACGNEGETEFVIFTTGTSTYNPSGLSMIGSSVATTASGFTGNLSITNQLNGYVGICSPNVFVAAPNPIPPNSKVIAFPSSVGLGSLPATNLAAYCGTGPIYVLAGNYGGGTNGFFVNGAAGCTSGCLRTFTIDFGGGCTVSSTYDRVTFPTGNGVNIKPGGQIVNPGDCFPPPPFACTPPTPPVGYGCGGTWNVLAYESSGNTLNFTAPTTFKGSYVTNDDPVTGVNPPAPTVVGAGSFMFDTGNELANQQDPISNTTGYTGCPTAADGFSFWAKKSCFSCNYYKIFVKEYDDFLKVIVDTNGDGTPEFTSPTYTFGQVSNAVIWEGFLNNSSKVDIQGLDFTPGGGNFFARVAFCVQPITLAAANNGPKCPGSSANLTATLSPTNLSPTPAFTYSWTGSNGFTSSLQNPTVSPITAASAGTYTVTLAPIPAGCPPVTALTALSISNVNFIAPPDLTVCGSLPVGPLLVTGNPPPSNSATYIWSGPNLNSTLSNPTFTPPVSSTPGGTLTSNYNVTVTDGGCQWTGTFKVTAVSPPSAPNVQTPITACAGQQINLTTINIVTGLPFPPTITALPAAVNFNWTGPNGFTSTTTYGPGSLPYSVSATAPTTPGTYSYSLGLSTSLLPGCTTPPAIVTVNVSAAPILMNKTVCAGTNIDLNTLFVSGQTPGTWSSGTGTGVSGTNFLSTGLNGNYTLTFTPTSSTCTATSVITVLPGATPTINAPATLCSGVNVNLTVSPSGFTGYNWTFNNAPVGSNATLQTSGAGTYSVTVTNAQNCTGVYTTTITPSVPITPTLAGNPFICGGGFTNLSISNIPAFNSYNWLNGSNSSISNNSSATITATGTYTVTVSDASGCTGSLSFTVNAFPAVSVAITGASQICPLTATTLSVPNTFSLYKWDYNNSTTNSVSVPNGTYTVTVTDGNGCTAKDTKAVTLFTPPSPTITGATSVCVGATTALSVGGGVFTNYAWTPVSVTGASPTVGVGNYTVVVTDGNGCTASTSKNITNDNVTAGITGTLNFCPGASTTLSSSGSFSSYKWSPNNEIGSSITVSTAGTYGLTVTNSNGCTGTATVNVTQLTPPVFTINAPSEYCEGNAPTLTTTPTFNNYTWSNGTPPNASTPSFAVTGTGTYSVTVSNTGACSATKSVSITQNNKPKPTIAGSTTICAGGSTTLDAGSGYSAYNWSGSGGTKQTAAYSTIGTYSVTVTDTKGCTGIGTVTITSASALSPVITGPKNFCPSGKTTLSAGASFKSYKWNTSATTPTIDVTVAGIYSVTVSNGICSGTASTTITENPAPVVNIIGDITICEGEIGTLTTDKTFSSYNWNPTGLNQSITFTKAGKYQITVTDAANCVATAEVSTVVNPIPKPAIAGKSSFCEGDKIEIAAATGFKTYKWSSGENINKITVDKEGTYIVTVSDGKCTGIDSIKIVKNLKPILVLSKDTAICSGNEVTLLANAGAANYKWSTGDATPSINVKIQKTYIVTVTNTDGCFVIDSVKVKVNTTPVPVIDVPNTICVGEKAIFKLTEKYDKYVWSNGKMIDTIQVNDTQLYSVTVTTKDGCSASTSKSVAIKNSLNPSIVGKTKFCEGETVTLGLDATYFTYEWSDNSTKDSLKIDKNGTYSVSVTSSSGCKGFAFINVVKNPNPTPNITGSTVICAGKPTVLGVNSIFSTYKWSNNSSTPTISVAKSGDYKVTVTDINGCKGETIVTVNENQISGTLTDTLCQKDFLTINGKKYDITNPSGAEIIKVAGGCDSTVNIKLYFRNEIAVNLESAGAICKGQSTDITVKTSGFTGIFDLTYEDDNGNSFDLKGIQSGAKIPVLPSKKTTYTIKSTSIPNGKCATTLGTTTININEVKLAVTTSNFNGFGVSCNGKDDGAAKATASQGSLPYIYNWSVGFTGADIDRLKAGKYKVTATDAVGCTVVDSIEIKQAQKISIAFKAQNPLCASTPKGSIILTDIVGGSGTYFYSTDDVKFSAVGSKPFNINGLSTGTYNLTIKDENGCSVLDQVKIEDGKSISVDLGEDKQITFGDSVVITPTADFQMKAIKWTNTKYLSCDTCQFAIAKPKVTTGFSVTVFDLNGCSATDNILIIVSTPRNVFVPTAFSPGTDGTNDLFRPFLGIGAVKINFFRVYDRWGDVVYEDLNFTRAQSQEATRGWDGTFRGKEMNSAVFTYAIEVEFLDGVKKILKGDITLLRND
jgi:gliding motility-associated-like protein